MSLDACACAPPQSEGACCLAVCHAADCRVLVCANVPACSRNARLSPEARSDALSISAALRWAQQAVAQGEVTQAADIAASVRQRIAAAGGDVDYVEVGNGGDARASTALLTRVMCMRACVLGQAAKAIVCAS